MYLCRGRLAYHPDYQHAAVFYIPIQREPVSALWSPFFVRGSVKIIAGPRCKVSYSSLTMRHNNIGFMIWELQHGGYYRIAAYSVNDPQQRQ